MPTLYLIDAFAQFFRAYHAIRSPMSSPVTKEPTNMTFGFVGMLLKLLRGEGKISDTSPTDPSTRNRADYIAAALDVSGDTETFRSTLYPDYKAHRPPPPEDLMPQVERCLSILRAVGVPVLGAAGFEADDAIATIVSQLRRERPDIRVRFISKDKDLKQLLDAGRTASSHGENGSLAAPVEMYDIHTDELQTVESLRAETGLAPAQVIDMLALMGDTVDNVPGVEGVGPKTAAQLVAQYGSLDNVIAHASEIKGKRGEAIRAATERLPLSRTLVTLRHDTPVRLELTEADRTTLNLEALLPILRELGFNRYQDEVKALLGAVAGSSASSIEGSASATNSGASPTTHAASRAGLFSSASPARTPTSVKSESQTVERELAASAAMKHAPERAAASLASRPGKKSNRADDSLSGGLFDAPVEPTSSPADAAAVITTPTSVDGADYRCITTREQLDALVAQLRTAPIISIDTETTHISAVRCQLCGIAISIAPHTGVYIPVRSPTPDKHLNERTVLDALRPILEDPTRPKTGHNLKYDLIAFRRQGVMLRGLGTSVNMSAHTHASDSRNTEPEITSFDSMVASFLIDASRSSHSLDALALALLGRTNISIKDLIGHGKDQRTFDTVPLEHATAYAAEDADVALQLRNIMNPQLRAMDLMDLFTQVELPLVEVLAEMEWNGILVDPAELERQRDRLQKRIDDLHNQIDDAAMGAIGRTFNPDSPKQLAAALFNKATDVEPGLGIKPVKKTKTGYSTDIEVLEKLAQDVTLATPIPTLILEHRQLSKLVGTYLAALTEDINPETRRIHSSFNQTVAVTGRLASSDPNLQNIPIRTDVGREIRKAFIAAPGCVLISADYSQIELRLLAHLSRDPALIQAFHEGQDIHTAVAAQIHNINVELVTKAQRSGAKMVNFGIVYGITSYGLARRLGIGNDEAESIITGYKKRFAGITTFLEECIAQAQRQGYVETMLKRRRPIPEIDSTNPSKRAFAERTAINSVVQGSAADLIKLAMVNLFHEFPAATSLNSNATPPAQPRLLLQIHDELVFECPDSLAEATRTTIKARMEQAMTLSVPLVADTSVATNWFDGK